MSHAAPTTSAIRRVRSPGNLHRTARNLLLGLVVFGLAVLVTPWQQTSLGEGKIVAFDPASRTQGIEVPIKGRVVEWHVVEGQAVKAGDKIATMQDNDPEFLGRLRQELETVDERLRAAEDTVAAYDAKLEAAELTRDAAIAAAQAKVSASERKVDASRQKQAIAQADFDTADLNTRRVDPLFKDGLVSERQLELTVLKQRETEAKLLETKAGVAEAQADLAAATSSLAKEREEQRGKIETTRAERQAALQKLAELRAKRLETEVKLSRQGAQEVTAPIDGTILAILAGQGGEQLKEGDVLARLVPTNVFNVVELLVDGNDVPLIKRGQEVRLQFEGWPAVQFAGWPGVAVGTFPGEVVFVDPADDGSGKFRVVVREPEYHPDEPWPDERFLRQGIKSKGWVLLSTVPLGWELWRLANGFPPSVEPPKEGEAPRDGPKMPKALVPKSK